MFTTCPSCRMNLAVTVADLRIGQGYVRCGRCERVFNALMSLAEDIDPEERSGLAAHGTGSMPMIEFEDDSSDIPDSSDTPDSGDIPDSGDNSYSVDDSDSVDASDPDDTADPGDTADSGAHEQPRPAAVDFDLAVMDSASTGTFETIVLEGDTYTQVEEHLDEEQMAQRLRDMTGEPAPAAAAQVEEFDADAAVGNTPRRHWGWAAAIAGLALLLAGQFVHHSRQALVANPWLETPMKTLYGFFGVTLEPEWDLDGYELRQLGGEALALNSTTLVLRATVLNRAPSPQPPPLIRVELQDRFGNTLSTSFVAPADYLRAGVPKRMAAGERLDAELHLEDPNRQASSWDLDACLPGLDGAHHCANVP